MSYTKNGDYMDLQPFYVKYEYPMTGDIQIDNELQLNIDNQVNSFYKEVYQVIPTDIEYSLEITYDKKVYSDYVTYIIYNTFYLGGAHPNTTIQTFTYKNGKRIEINDLLNQKELEKVSSFIANKLLKHEGSLKDMVEEGTFPIYDNFKNFYYTEKGIVFIFEQYQVAPYSSGIIEVLVPYSILKY